MASIVQHFLQRSVKFLLTLLMALLHLSDCMHVHLNYTRPKVRGHALPEVLNITLTGESGYHTNLHLKHVHNLPSSVPVYTLSIGTDGMTNYQREILEVKQDQAYYEDAESEAVIQVTRINGSRDTEDHLELIGEITIDGQKYSLSPERRSKRDTAAAPSAAAPSAASSAVPPSAESSAVPTSAAPSAASSAVPPSAASSAVPTSAAPSAATPSAVPSAPVPSVIYEDGLYTLVPQDMPSYAPRDFLDAPPEQELKHIEIVNPVDLPTLPPSNISSSPESGRSRRQSQNVQNIIIDVAGFVDFAAFSRFLSRYETRSAAMEAISEYYAFIFHIAGLRFQRIESLKYAFSLRLIKLVVAENSLASTFTEKFRKESLPWDHIDARKSLDAFSIFVARSGRDILLPSDHVMLFTGYDLTSLLANGSVSKSTTGVSYMSTMCRTDGKSVSVVECLGGLQNVGTVCHEIGHSFSSLHDGDDNDCLASDLYVMSPGGKRQTDRNKLNPWHFSPCSIEYFTRFTNNQLRTETGKRCLLAQLSISDHIPDVSNRLPGQEVSPDDQCRMIYGNASRLCRFASANICTEMFCYDPKTTGTCFQNKATMGTTCGNGKLCLNGKCVSDSRAPSVDDNCVFGDQPGTTFNNKTCSAVNEFSGYCYHGEVRQKCCASCQKLHRNVSGCEYGDAAARCTANICKYASPNTLRQCCGTCNYGTPSERRQSNPPIIRSKPSALAEFTTVQINASKLPCIDQINVLINGARCPKAILLAPVRCNNSSIQAACCMSCRRYGTRSRRA